MIAVRFCPLESCLNWSETTEFFPVDPLLARRVFRLRLIKTCCFWIFVFVCVWVSTEGIQQMTGSEIPIWFCYGLIHLGFIAVFVKELRCFRFAQSLKGIEFGGRHVRLIDTTGRTAGRADLIRQITDVGPLTHDQEDKGMHRIATSWGIAFDADVELAVVDAQKVDWPRILRRRTLAVFPRRILIPPIFEKFDSIKDRLKRSFPNSIL